MIEWGTGANKTQVECLTRHDEQMMELRLSKRRSPNLPPTVMLEEPSAIEFARIRKAALAADATINDKYPRPEDPPDEIPGESEVERLTREVAFQKVMAQWLDDRHNYRTDEDHAPYANVVVQAVNMLTEFEITLGDLPPECFKSAPLQGLLEVWETPLGGAVSPVEIPSPDSAPPMIPPTDDSVTEPSVAPKPDEATPEADSPESTRSSPPGGEPSLPSPPPSSTT